MRHFVIILVVAAMLALSGCAGGQTEAKPTAKPAKYAGFMDLKAGQWAEVVTKSGGETVKTRTEVIESSPSLAKFQIITEADGQETVAQFWLDRREGKPTKYLVKSGEEVMCLDVSQMPKGAVPSEGGAYPSDKPGITHGTYPTPTGKEVTVAKFTTSSGEIWVSSEVPFGLVKTVSNGKTVSSLYDFGTIGAKSRIDEADAEDCRDMSEEVSYVAAPPEQEEEQTDYEAYYESEPADEDQNYEASTYERGTGEDVDFNCADCEGMPAMAKNTCLAACR
ncbi:MAG: hypothetical protein KKD17_03490 [Nanoarchaeota archaeon]|nr:hypothetical protein [Nanoarchaeota archaeon]